MKKLKKGREREYVAKIEINSSYDQLKIKTRAIHKSPFLNRQNHEKLQI